MLSKRLSCMKILFYVFWRFVEMWHIPPFRGFANSRMLYLLPEKFCHCNGSLYDPVAKAYLFATFGRFESELSLICHKVLNLCNYRTCLIKKKNNMLSFFIVTPRSKWLVKSPIPSNQVHEKLLEYRDWNLLK